MGHIRLGELARTREWIEVVSLLENGADCDQVATATILAAEQALKRAVKDKGVIEAVWLLTQLPLDAKNDNFTAALHDHGVYVSENPGLYEIVAGISQAIDRSMPNCRGRSDLGEMAQTALSESLTRVIGDKTRNLFGGTTHEDVRAVMASLGTVSNFGRLAREFFARFTNKCLQYFLSRTMAQHTGAGRRFATLSQQTAFTGAIRTHCYEAAYIVETFSGDWCSKENYETGKRITREGAERFTGGAMAKLIAELKEGAGTHVA